jgi:hypothetical protein
MKFIDALFCDDIRHESNNKVSLMGLYNDSIVLRPNVTMEVKWPVSINLATLLRFSLEETEKYLAEFIFEYFLNEKTIIKIDGKINLDNTKKIFTLAITGNGIPLEPGNLGFSIKIYAENHVYLSEINKTALKIMHGIHK